MPRQRPLRRRLWYGFFAFTFLGFIWPGMTLANRVEPFILGFPFLFFWFVAIVVLQFAGLVVMYLTDRGE